MDAPDIMKDWRGDTYTVRHKLVRSRAELLVRSFWFVAISTCF